MSKLFIDDVLLSVIIALAILFARTLLNLTWTVIHRLLLHSKLFRWLSFYFFVKAITFNGQAVEVFKIGNEAHDQIDLIFRLQVHIKASQDRQGRQSLYAPLKVFEDNILQV